MSDSSLFGEQPAPEAAPSRTPDRRLLLGGAAVLTVGAALAGFMLLGGSSEEAPLAARTATGAAVKPAATTPAAKAAAAKAAAAKAAAAKAAAAKKATTAAKAPVAVLPAATTVQAGRNPFKALYVIPEEAPAEAAPAAVVTPAAVPAGSAPAAVVPVEYPLTLLAISQPADADAARTYSFKVDGVNLDVIAGQRFGKYGELVVLAFSTDAKGKAVSALVQIGDATPRSFALNEPQKVL